MSRRHFRRSIGILLGTLVTVALPRAADVKVVGLAANKAIVVIGTGAPRTLTVGQKTAEGITLIAVGGETATFEIDGQRRVLSMGQHYAPTSASASERVVLSAGDGGHFMASGQVNGGSIRFLVDTGATVVAIPASDARRIGINYLNAPRALVQTANGTASAFQVKFDTVSVGGLTLNNVDGMVLESGLAMPLLGMSFLKRTSMQREGETLVLVKRF